MPKQVHIVGDPETYDVLCETDTTKILINPRARARRDIAQLEAQLEQLRKHLADALGGHAIAGP